MPTLVLAAVLIAFGLALRTQAAPTPNPVEIERDAERKLQAVPTPPGADDIAAAPLTPEVRQYLDTCRPALAELGDAAKLPAAQYPPIDGDVNQRLHHLSGPRAASNVLRLAARADAEAGHPDAVVDDLLTGMAVGRHTGQEKLWIGRLVEVGIECTCIDALAARLPSLPDATVAALPARLDALPPAATLAETVDAEQAFGKQTLQIGGRGPGTRPAVDALQLKTFDAAGPLYDAARRSAALPPDAFAAAVDAAAAKLLANPYAQTLAPSLRTLRGSLAVVEAKRAMLRAAIDARLHGQATLTTARDPFGDGPFALTPQAGGAYRLESRLTTGRQKTAVALTVGQ